MPNPTTTFEFDAVILQNEGMDDAYVEVPYRHRDLCVVVVLTKKKSYCEKELH